MEDLKKCVFESAVLIFSGEEEENVPIQCKLGVQIHSTDITFYFLIFSATTSP